MNVTVVNKFKKEGLNKEITKRLTPATSNDGADSSQDVNMSVSL